MRYISATLIIIFLAFSLANPCPAKVSQESGIPFLLKFTDDASLALKIGALRHTQIPHGTREIRLWTGFGIIIPNRMVAFTVTPSGKVSGTAYFWYGKLDYMSAGRRNAFHKELKRDWGCTSFLQHGDDEACRSSMLPDSSWKALLKTLESIGLCSLPDESTLPKPNIIVMDGFSMVVEIRDGSEYRAYAYSNPWARPEPEAEAAAKIMRLLNEALSPGT